MLQLSVARSALRKVEDLPWSEGYAYQVAAGQPLDFTLRAYNFATNTALGRLQVIRQPRHWDLALPTLDLSLASMSRGELAGSLRIESGAEVRDGWVVLRADCGSHGQPTLAFRVLVRE